MPHHLLAQDVVNNLRLTTGGVEDRKQFALKIAKDLFQVTKVFPLKKMRSV